jgi:hypothetical protein
MSLVAHVGLPSMTAVTAVLMGSATIDAEDNYGSGGSVFVACVVGGNRIS